MLIHHPLDEALATWSHIAILRALQDSAQGLTGREIARQAGLSHRACYRALARLEQLHVLQRQRGGKTHFLRLNRRHQLVSKAILPLFTAERNFSSEFYSVLRKRLGRYALSVILFGSVARKQERPESDVDLCFVVQGRKEKSALQKKVHEISSPMFQQFGALIAPIFLTLAEFQKKARSKSQPVADILAQGIVIAGISLRKLRYG